MERGDEHPPPLPTPPAAPPADPADPPPDVTAPATPPERSKLKQTLHSLRTPFRSGSPFHIGKRGAGKSDPDAAPTAASAAHKSRKKSKKGKTDDVEGDSGGGGTSALVRKLSGIRRGRRRVDDAADESPVPDPTAAAAAPAAAAASAAAVSPAAPANDDADSHSSSRDADEPPPAPAASAAPAAPAAPTADALATDHRISTLPFVKSAWQRKTTPPAMERPVETPSPDDTLRRRIAFVAQASMYLSEEGADEGEAGAEEGMSSLERVVELAHLRLGCASAHTPPAGRHSRTSDRSQDTETETDVEHDEAVAMPAYGDLLAPHDPPPLPPPPPHAMGATSSASHAGATGAGGGGAGAGERREHLYKILVIGELGTGKTSIIKRYVHQFFSQHYRATIGVDFALKVLNWDANTVIRLQLWDIAGQERFGNMTRVYYKEAVGAFIVYDVTRVATFDAVLKWKTDLDSKVQLPDGSPIPCVLLANKCDQQKEGIVNTPAKMEEFCRERGFSGWFETSAKENVNIEEAARSLVNKILLNDKLLQSADGKDNDRIALDPRFGNGGEGGEGSGKNCAC